MILAIDIGGTFIKFGLVDDDFKISNQSKVPTPPMLDDFWLTLEHIVSSHKDIISGIAIACPGEIINVASFSRRSYPIFNGYSSWITID